MCGRESVSGQVSRELMLALLVVFTNLNVGNFIYDQGDVTSLGNLNQRPIATPAYQMQLERRQGKEWKGGWARE